MITNQPYRVEKRPSIFLTFLVWFLSNLLILTPLFSYASGDSYDSSGKSFSEIGRDAQRFGVELTEGINIGEEDNGASFNITQGESNYSGSFDINELFPGTSSSNTDPAGTYFPEEGALTVDDMKKMGNSSDEMNNLGDKAKGGLYKDSTKEHSSTTGAAYDVLVTSKDYTGESFKNDPMMNLTRETLADLESIKEDFGDCSIDTKIKDKTSIYRQPDIQKCEKVIDKTDSCTINHNYSASVISHHSGPYNLSKCGEGCQKLWIGRVGNNYWSGTCKIYEEYTEVTVDKPDAITKATLEYVEFDDYMQVWVGVRGKEEKVYNGPNDNFPPETAGKCELSTSWKRSPNVDVTKYFKEAKPGDVLTFKIRVSVTGGGEGFGRIIINYDPEKSVHNDVWTPQSCVDSAVGVKDGFAKGHATCIDMPKVSGGCTTVNGTDICGSALKPSPIEGISKFCKKVDVVADFDYYKGEMDCFIDINGEEQCPVNSGGNLDSCKEYEENNQCGFMYEECVDGATGDSGTCYVKEVTYDCGTEIAIPDKEFEDTYECGGPMKCMGEECLDIERESSDSFSKAFALLNAAQYMTHDMQCTGMDSEGRPTGDENVNCRVFSGKAGECKKAVGGFQTCCKKPSGISLVDYLVLIRSVVKTDAAIIKLEDGSMVKGAYQTLREPVMSGWNTVTSPLHTSIENITGKATTMKEGVATYAKESVSAMKEKMSAMVQKIMGGDDAAMQAAASAAGGAVEDDAANVISDSILEQGMSVLSTINTIYTAYTMAKLAASLIWKCTDKEMEMNAQRAMEQCTYVGSYCKKRTDSITKTCIERREAYCCYNSPLSRIMQEQIKKAKGEGFGSAKNPSCGGIWLDELDDVDWDKVDLSEWLAILQKNGQFPDPSNITMDGLTGKDHAFDTDGNRLNSEERLEKRLEDLDVYELRDEAGSYVPIDIQGSAASGY